MLGCNWIEHVHESTDLFMEAHTPIKPGAEVLGGRCGFVFQLDYKRRPIFFQEPVSVYLQDVNVLQFDGHLSMSPMNFLFK